ncbi:hypothetical protein CEXT_541911 [Caerostris extrusa]|uniref:Uncharacterized protein n=1 Tax=Caerostris extrusa TaxID=172846 RepID=A0AAV4MJ20_CAEEX|nr:hypothetical protein CEXT_541911 [Caerostris extrusa]
MFVLGTEAAMIRKLVHLPRFVVGPRLKGGPMFKQPGDCFTFPGIPLWVLDLRVPYVQTARRLRIVMDLLRSGRVFDPNPPCPTPPLLTKPGMVREGAERGGEQKTGLVGRGSRGSMRGKSRFTFNEDLRCSGLKGRQNIEIRPLRTATHITFDLSDCSGME